MPSPRQEDFSETTVGQPVTSDNTSFEAVGGVPQTAGTGVVGRIGNGVQITSGDSGGAGWSDAGLFDTGSGKRSAWRAYLRRDVAVTGDDLHFAWMTGHVNAGGAVVDEVSTGLTLWDLAWDGTNLWGTDSATIYKLDPATAAVLDSFAAPTGSSRGVAWDGTHLRVLNSTADTIYRVDPSTGATASSAAVEDALAWYGLAWDGSSLWGVDGTTGSKRIVEIDPTTGATLSTIPLPSGWSPRGLTWDGEALWLADTADDELHRIDPTTGTVTTTIPVTNPIGLTWDAANLRLSTSGQTLVTLAFLTATTALSLSVTTTGTLAATGLTLDTGTDTLTLGEWYRAEAELVANGDDVDVTVRLFTGASVDSDSDNDAAGVLTGTIAGGTALLADASLTFGRDTVTTPTAGTVVLDDVAFDTYPPPPVVAPGSIVAGMNWWDGTNTLKADLIGWWDGTTVQPVEFLGIWDGTTIQPAPE